MNNGLLFLAIVPVLVFTVIGIRFVTRGTPVKRVQASTRASEAAPIEDSRFLANLELLAKVDLLPGNTVELCTCGDETYPRLWDDMRRAHRSITLQMYYAQPGRVADTFHAIMCERAKAGVKVLFLRDAFGAQKLKGEYLASLERAGVEVATFRPVNWWALEKAYTRSHIRVATCDATVGWTGGFGIDDKWLGNGRTHDQWRDTTARFTGPAVAQLQATFAAGWAEATGSLLTGDAFFPADRDAVEVEDPRAGVMAGVLHVAPTIGSTAAERFVALVIASARTRLWITNAYFVPDVDFVGLLTHAVERGTDVRLLVPCEESDAKSVLYASRAAYPLLLRGGVRIFEYQPAMHHAKSLVADSLFGAVGTMNFDNRSLAFNDETMLAFHHAATAQRLEQVFEEDLGYSREITLREYEAFPAWQRAAGRMLFGMRRML